MLFGIGIAVGIGIDAQPVIVIETIDKSRTKKAVFSLFINFVVSPADLYYTAQDQGFCNAFSCALQDP